MTRRSIHVLLWLPLAGFVILLGVAFFGLRRPHDQAIVSQMVGAPLPAFALPALQSGAPITERSFVGRGPRFVNFFASWCAPCRTEGQELQALRQAGIPVDGITVRDLPAGTFGFLRTYGNPYDRIARDDAATLQVSLGSSGVPETFLVDGRGIVRRQVIGPIQPEDVAGLIAEAKAAR